MSNMVNFRMKQSELEAIDAVANRLGVTRSDFIRDAVKERIARHVSESPVAIPSGPSQGCKGGGNPRACQIKQLAKLATGVKVCTVCGVRTT